MVRVGHQRQQWPERRRERWPSRPGAREDGVRRWRAQATGATWWHGWPLALAVLAPGLTVAASSPSPTWDPADASPGSGAAGFNAISSLRGRQVASEDDTEAADLRGAAQPAEAESADALNRSTFRQLYQAPAVEYLKQLYPHLVPWRQQQAQQQPAQQGQPQGQAQTPQPQPQLQLPGMPQPMHRRRRQMAKKQQNQLAYLERRHQEELHQLQDLRAAILDQRRLTNNPPQPALPPRDAVTSLLEFPVLAVQAPAPWVKPEPFLLRLPGHWTRNASEPTLQPCLAVVESAGACTASAFPADAKCQSKALWAESQPDNYLSFEVPRPPFTFNVHPEKLQTNHSVCIRHFILMSGQASWFEPRPDLLGTLRYLTVPTVRFISGAGGIFTKILVRMFLNPGWHSDVELPCTNCSTNSRLALQLIMPAAPCRFGALSEITASTIAALRSSEIPASSIHLGDIKWWRLRQLFVSHQQGREPEVYGDVCTVPNHGPCRGFWDQALIAAGPPRLTPRETTSAQPGAESESEHWLKDGSTATFTVEHRQRVVVKQRRLLFRHRSAICFYPDEGVGEGWLLGYASLKMDTNDTMAFVGCVCFFGGAVPMAFIATALLHMNKYARCKRHVQEARLQAQREQLGRELASRGEGQLQLLSQLAREMPGPAEARRRSQQLLALVEAADIASQELRMATEEWATRRQSHPRQVSPEPPAWQRLPSGESSAEREAASRRRASPV